MGLHLEMGLFTRKSGKIWAYANFLEKNKFDLEHLQLIVINLYEELENQIPYQGLILSRFGSKVTINRGSNSGLKIDQEINVIQIVGITRHPQFQFITQVQKEILGKIHITKIDDNLSFGYILFEKESQVIQPGLKLLLHEPIFNQNLVTSKNERVVEHLLSRGDGSVIMQGESNEWAPEASPSFGRIQILFGMGEFEASTNLVRSGGQQGSTFLALNAQVDADLWLTRTWFLKTRINQGSAQIKNPLSGSSPSKLNFSMQDLKISAGYDFEISPKINGPRIQALIGVSQFNAAVTDSSPTSFTSTSFNGIGFGLTGFMPVDELDSKWSYGAELWYHLLPTVTESPLTSGTPKNSQIIELSGLGYYRWKPNFYILGKLTLESFNTQFIGTGTRIESATSSDISWTRFNGGIEYLF